jgi:hypothetical protein
MLFAPTRTSIVLGSLQMSSQLSPAGGSNFKNPVQGYQSSEA